MLAAPDKFRGSLSAAQVVAAVRRAAAEAGWRALGQPMADGGEGILEAFGGPDRTSTVTGPLGAPVTAGWHLGDGSTAIVESAAASGLAVAGGAEANDPIAASTAGTGELIAEAVLAGARRVIVGLGGSATTDGGYGAVQAVRNRLGGKTLADLGVELLAACDVQTRFVDAARDFGPQKGATPEQVAELTVRLQDLAGRYAAEFGLDLSDLPGAGAAGGLGGGLVALGARLVPGFDLVADQVGLDRLLDQADLVVTGEGALDAESFNGKVVGGVVERARGRGLPVLVVAGVVRDAPEQAVTGLSLVSLEQTFGVQLSWDRTADCVHQVVRDHLDRQTAAS